MEELIRNLRSAGARCLLIGGQAVRLHGLPRFSMDWDFFIPARDEANFRLLDAALAAICDEELEPPGPRGQHIIQTLQTTLGVVQFHLAVPGLPSFDEADARAVELRSETGQPIRCLSAEDLLASKRATNRPQDQQDIAFLCALLERNSP